MAQARSSTHPTAPGPVDLLVKGGRQQRTDSTHVLDSIGARQRIECVGETMRYALNRLVVAAHNWLLAHSRFEWLDRYGQRIEEHRPFQGGAQNAYLE